MRAAALAAPLAGALLGCGGAPTLDIDGAPRAIRPTDGAGWNGNGYGNVKVERFDSPSGRFRIHYTLQGESAVSARDVAPPDGVPDFVNEVAAAADATWQSTIVQRGFRPPLDDSVYHDRPNDYGGDGRFDIYLRAVGAGSDGYRVSEVCTEVPYTCSGYFVMTPHFRGSHYGSDREGAQVLTSHELFHNVQGAYDARQWQTFAEGTAVWNQTQVFPEGGLRDFLGFLPAFLDAPERPFDRVMGIGAANSYAYGSALWPQYLGERFGTEIIREIWEGCESKVPGRSPHFLDATEGALGRRGTTLRAAWQEFTLWNLLTAGRAAPGRGYQLAARYPSVRTEPRQRGLGEWPVEIEGLSARYLPLQPDLAAPRRLRLSFLDESATPAEGTVLVQPQGEALGEARPFPSGRIDLDVAPGDTLFVVVSGVVRGGARHTLTVRLADAPPPAMGGCSAAPGAAPPGAPALPLLLGLLGVLPWCRRAPARAP